MSVADVMPEGMSGERVLVVVNPVARGGASELACEVERQCLAGGVHPVSLRAVGVDEMTDSIVESTSGGGWAAVIAVGGDGTARTCASGLAAATRFDGEVGSERRAPLLVVPGGTGNSVYRALWEDRPWPEVLALVLRGEVRARDVDLLAVRGVDSGVETTSLLGVTAGLIAEVVRVSQDLPAVSGRERYAAALGPALDAHRPFPARVTLDGALLRDGAVSLVAVGGARHRSGTFEILPRSILDDGLLDVCVVDGVDGEGFVALAGAVLEGKHVGRPGVAYGQGRAVRIERTDGELLVTEHDGDPWPAADSALEISVDGSVRMWAPAVAVAG